ncbi:MAG: FG-GAP-like repeat-containing protein [Candidatus Syntrophosphaera sp.]
MKVKDAVLVLIVLFCAVITEQCYAQSALQEIVRFDLMGNVEGFSQADPGGDINGDGRPDLVFSYWETGEVDADIYIYHSIPDSNAVPDQILHQSEAFGYSLAYAGDLNGDGIDDLVVGSPDWGFIHQGAIAIYWGGATLSAQPDVFIDGYPFGYTQSWDLSFGKKLITHCDINGDGINDLLVYAEGPQWENWGNVYVFLGGTPFSTTPALHIRGSIIYEYLGKWMATGDMNGDGFDDIIVCSSRRTPPPPDESEEHVYDLKIYAGGVNLSNVPVYESQVASYTTESSISGMIAHGDLNGDGMSDITMQYNYAEGRRLKILYGQPAWDGLTPYEAEFNLSDLFWLYSYCNLIDDQYSDLLFYSHYIPGTSEDYGSICILEQTSPALDLNIDYVNSDYSETHYYGSTCYELGDMNQDGYNEFLVWAFNHSSNGLPSYVKILSQSYTGIDDDVLPVQDIRIDCYPNPFSQAMTISLGKVANREKIKNLKIYDLKGRLVYETNIFGLNSYQWDGKDRMGKPVSSGIYILQAMDTGNKKHLTKFVRMK